MSEYDGDGDGITMDMDCDDTDASNTELRCSTDQACSLCRRQGQVTVGGEETYPLVPINMFDSLCVGDQAQVIPTHDVAELQFAEPLRAVVGGRGYRADSFTQVRLATEAEGDLYFLVDIPQGQTVHVSVGAPNADVVLTGRGGELHFYGRSRTLRVSTAGTLSWSYYTSTGDLEVGAPAQDQGSQTDLASEEGAVVWMGAGGTLESPGCDW